MWCVYLCVCVIILQVGFSGAQGESIAEIPTESPGEATELPTTSDWSGDQTEAVPLPDMYESDVICNECACNEGVADCSNLELRKVYEDHDWSGLLKYNIVEVDLSRNLFVSVTQFPELQINKLNLSNCEIEIMEDATFSNLRELAVLDLSKNKMSFTTIGRHIFLGYVHGKGKPLAFANLRYLNLAYNDIHSLSQDVFMFMPHLTYLDLSGNPLAFIDQVTMGAMSDLSRLQELRLSECDLDTLPEGLLRRQRKLQRLDLSGNRFATVPTALGEAANLVYLNFDKNPIQNLTERTAISNLTNLQELHLSRHSKLRSISAGALGGLESLVVLHMKYNPRLTYLDPGFLEWEDDLEIERWPLLQELYLNNNNLSEINSKMLDHWDKLVTMDFSANPYLCDCNIQWMIDVLVPLIMGTSANATIGKMVCRKPDDYRGLTFAQLYESRKELVCVSSESVIDVSAAQMAVLYGIFIGVLVAFPIVLVVVILWKKGYFARCRKKMNSKRDYFDEEETDAF